MVGGSQTSKSCAIRKYMITKNIFYKRPAFTAKHVKASTPDLWIHRHATAKRLFRKRFLRDAVPIQGVMFFRVPIARLAAYRRNRPFWNRFPYACYAHIQPAGRGSPVAAVTVVCCRAARASLADLITHIIGEKQIEHGVVM